MFAVAFRRFAFVMLAASVSTVVPNAAAQPTATMSSAVSVAPPISDCDDTNPNVHPGAAEVINWIDDNCNGLADEAPDGTPSADSTDNDADTWSVGQGDCNDTASAVHPGAAEVADRVDNDCDGLADEDEQDHPSSDTIDMDADTYSMSNDRLFYGGFES